MSKRSGTYVTLQELIDDVGKDAARFFFILRSADSQMDFDLDLAKSQSADNPVFYVQYAHARICSILRQGEAEGVTPTPEADFALLTAESEQDLMKKILELPEEIAYAATQREPASGGGLCDGVGRFVPHFLRQLPGIRGGTPVDGRPVRAGESGGRYHPQMFDAAGRERTGTDVTSGRL